MNGTTVESTTLAIVAYDDVRELLQLEFRSRAIYRYFYWG
jgi:KTSC domain